VQADHYEWEDVILDEANQVEWEGMKKSLYFGLGCGVAGFGMLRWRRRGRLIGGGFSDGLSKYASSSSSKPKSSSGGYTFDPVPPPTKPNNNALQQNMQQQSYNSAYRQQSYSSSKTGLIIVSHYLPSLDWEQASLLFKLISFVQEHSQFQSVTTVMAILTKQQQQQWIPIKLPSRLVKCHHHPNGYHPTSLSYQAGP